MPDRNDTNRRLLSESDVLRLQLLKKATEAGHSISQIAKLSSDELLRRINAKVMVNILNQSHAHPQPDADYFYELALNCVMQLNGDGLQNALEQASIHLTKLSLIIATIVLLY